ncbi:hypothetical protein GCM10011390_22930 [Aureimonas endophytica]|uniref:Uncharacterized protein n=1 Tax=Aureimonas endophytica TaxID=2027858 RepID=A0A916ZM20_9HYPH|nr:hypothetical protein GCM10011390_22930 [Aureimonas endophytica]
MIAIMKDRPSVSGTKRKWYIAVAANWSRDRSTTVMSIMIVHPEVEAGTPPAVPESSRPALRRAP